MQDTLIDMNRDLQYGMSACRTVPNPFPRQHGAALIMSLMFLMILTILGLAAMSTSSLEVKMSGNAQATTQALSAAESGLDAMVNSITKLDPTTTVGPTTYSYGASTARVSVNFVEYSTPPRGSGNSSVGTQAANFDVVSAGTSATALGGRSSVHQGLYQIGSAGN